MAATPIRSGPANSSGRHAAPPQAEVHFLVGGTQTNATVIDGLLRRHEGVLAAESGHINVHEAGAIEAAGHKVLTLPLARRQGPAPRRSTAGSRNSTATKRGPIWSPPGCSTSRTRPNSGHSTRSVRWRRSMPSANATRSRSTSTVHGSATPWPREENTLTLRDIARLCEIFYIGGTKTGLLFGEAGRHHAARAAAALLHPRQAARRPAGQGSAAGGAVRDALHRRALPADCPTGHLDSQAAERGPARKRIPAPHRLADQPTVLRPAEPRDRPAQSVRHLRVVGAARQGGVRRKVRHQLGPPPTSRSTR